MRRIRADDWPLCWKGGLIDSFLSTLESELASASLFTDRSQHDRNIVSGRRADGVYDQLQIAPKMAADIFQVHTNFHAGFHI